MKQIELNRIGLAPISDLEMNEVNGGGWTKWLKRFTWFGVAIEVIDHWDEIKKGLSDGWNFDRKKQ